jgi:phosphinothricin acetyltransferase
MVVRPATLDDAPALADIYNAEVTTSTVTFDLVPRTIADQRRWLSDRSGAHAVLVAEDAGEVVGFAALSPYRDRPAYATTVEDSIYLRADRRGTGLGKVLLAELVATARQHGFHAVMARVVGDHEASIALHRSVGFDLVGVEREVGRKFGRWLDVAVLPLRLGPTGDDATPRGGPGRDGTGPPTADPG